MRRFSLSLLILASMVLVAWPAGRASAAVDISGQWNMTLLHPDVSGAITCAATVTQGGTSLIVEIACSQLAAGTLSGTINENTGNFTLAGSIPDPMTFVGTAAQDGNSMSGFWVVDPVPGSGTFSGTRTAAPVGGVTELAHASSSPAGIRSTTDDGKLHEWIWPGGAGVGGVVLAALLLSRRRRA